MSAALRHLPVLPALPADRFACVKLRATISHEACVARRTQLHRHSRPGVTPWPAYPGCASCEQGAGIEASLRATTVVEVAPPTQNNAMGRRARKSDLAPVARVEAAPVPAPAAPRERPAPTPRLKTVPGLHCPVPGCAAASGLSDKRTAPELVTLCKVHRADAGRWTERGATPAEAFGEVILRAHLVGQPCPVPGCTGSAAHYLAKLTPAFRALCSGCRNRAAVVRAKHPKVSPDTIVEAMRTGGAA